MSNDTENAQEDERDEEHVLSIGAVSQATGISANTLRTWERRYGFPSPDRTNGRHRVYSIKTVEHLHMVNRALEQGHRPSHILRMPHGELRTLLCAMDSSAREETSPAAPPIDPSLAPSTPSFAKPKIEDWLDAARAFDSATLERALTRCWYTQGAITFLQDSLAPFVVSIGEAWSEGELSVAQEHFASELIQNFLGSQWRALERRSAAPIALCATLPGERHVLGLHMAATVVALAGYRVTFLGPNTPMESLLSTIASTGERLDMVLVSVSKAGQSATTEGHIGTLAKRLADDAVLVLGGSGAPEPSEGIERFGSLRELSLWAMNRWIEQRSVHAS